MNADRRAGRHQASDVDRRRQWSALASTLSSLLPRLLLLIVVLAGGAVSGGIGWFVAPLVAQPRESGFWGGVAIFFVGLAVTAAFCAVGHALGSRRFRWVARVCDVLT